MPGVIAAPIRKLEPHAGHSITYMVAATPLLWCFDCEVVIEQEYQRTSLYCGCSDQAEHDEGQRLQQEERKRGGISPDACVGCVIGDDGPSMHSCIVHQ
jgi:hypothetical protein